MLVFGDMDATGATVGVWGVIHRLLDPLRFGVFSCRMVALSGDAGPLLRRCPCLPLLPKIALPISLLPFPSP